MNLLKIHLYFCHGEIVTVHVYCRAAGDRRGPCPNCGERALPEGGRDSDFSITKQSEFVLLENKAGK